MNLCECGHEHNVDGDYKGQCFAQIDNDYRTCPCTGYRETQEENMTTSDETKEINKTTWEDLNPDWKENGDLTDRFAKSQFDNCPTCGTIEKLRVVNTSYDEYGAAVLCCHWQANGDTPSEAIDNWNTRADSLKVEQAKKQERDIDLKELDLTKCTEYPDGSGGLTDHPDIDPNKDYLVQYSGTLYAGQFAYQWYGLVFCGIYPSGAGFDAPGTNSSEWERIWEIVRSDDGK